MANKPLIKRRSVYTKNRLAIIFVLMTITALFVLMGFGANYVADTLVLVPDGDAPNIIHSAVPTDGSRPSDHDALESLAYAAERIYSSNYFRGETRGDVVADLGFMKYVQNVHNVRVVKGDYIFTEAISSSSLKSVAEQKFFVGKDTILHRPSTSVSGDSATFADDCSKLSLEAFYASYGVIPNEITKHIINTDTILSIRDDNVLTKQAAATSADGGEEEKNIAFEVPQRLEPDADGYYRFTLVLDPAESTKFYRNEVMTLAAASYVNFKSVELNFVIDENWYPVSVTSNENYDIYMPSLKFLGTMSMASSLTEVFTDIDGDGDIPEYEFFSNHFDTENTSGGEGALGVADYLSKAFGSYLDGSENLDLDADITINDKPIGGSLKLSVNVGTMDIKAKLGGLFVQYSGDKVYISNNALKGYVSVDKAKSLLDNEAISSLLGAIDLDGMTDDGLMERVLADCTMTTDNGVTTVRLPFSLADGIDIDASLLINEDMSLNAINGVINVKGTVIRVESAPKKTKFPTVDGSYKDISDILDFVPAALGTIAGKTYGVSGHVDAMGFAADIDAYIDRTDGLKAEAVISALGQDITVKYVDDALYAEIFNVKVKANAEDIPELISAITDVAEVDLSIIDKIKPLLPDNIVGYIGLLDDINVSGDTLAVRLKLIGVPVDIELKRSANALSALKLNLDANLFGTELKANADLSISAPERRDVRVDGNYIDVKEFLPFIPHITKYINADGLNIDIAAAVDGVDSPINVTGNIKIAYVKTDDGIDGITLSGAVSALGMNIDITVADRVLYAAVGNVKLKLELDSASDLIDAVKRILDMFVEKTDGKMLTEILNSVTLDSVKDGTLTASADALGANINLSVTPESGDVALTCAVGSAYISASAAVTPVSGIKPFSAPVGAQEYVDLTEFTVTVDKLAEICTTKKLSAPVSVAVGDISFSADVALDLNNGLAFALDGTTAPISVTYVDGTAYIAIGGLKLSCDKEGLDALLTSLGPVLPENVKTVLGGNKSIDVVGAVGSVVDAIKELTLKGGMLDLKLDVAGVSAQLGMMTDLSRTTLDINIGETAAHAELGAVVASSREITVPNGTFIPVGKFAPVLDAVLPLINADGYKVSIDGTLYGVDISAEVAVALPVEATETEDAKPVGLAVSLDIGDIHGISVTVANGTLYVVIPETLSVSCGLDDGEINTVIDEIRSALPKADGAGETLTALKDLIGAFKSSNVFDIIGALYGIDLDDGFVLGADFAGIGADLAAEITVAVEDEFKGISVSVDALGKNFVLNVTTELDEDGVLKAATATAGDDIEVTLSLDSKAIQSVESKENCTPITTYTQLVSPILELINTHAEAKTVSIAIDASLIKKTTQNYMDIECKDLTVSFGETVSLRAVVTLFSSTDAAQDVVITYADGIVYVKTGNVALSFDTENDIARIYDILEKYLPKYIADELKMMLGLDEGTSSLNEMGLLVKRIKEVASEPTVGGIISGLFSDLGALSGKSAARTVLDMVEVSAVDETPVIHATVFGVSLKLTPLLAEEAEENENAENEAPAVKKHLVGAEISTELLGMEIRLRVSDPISFTSAAEITAPTDAQYVSIMEFVHTIDKAIGTFTTVNPLEQDVITFDIPSFSFTYEKYATETDEADEITVTGRGESALKGKLTKRETADEDGTTTSTFSVALEAHVSLDMKSNESTTGIIDLDLYVLDRHPDSPLAYLGYVENGTGYGELISIDYTSVMQILAAVMDIIHVDEETTEALFGKYRLPVDTSIFDSMDIRGLDSIKDMLNALVDALNKAETAFDEVKAAVDIIKNAGSIDGLKGSLDDIKSHLKTAIDLFVTKSDEDEDENEKPNGSAIDGSMFGRIVNGVSFGTDTTDLWADVSNEITTGADGVAKINVASNETAINGISVTNLDVKKAHVDMNVRFIAGGSVEMSPAPTAAQYDASVDHSDLSNIKHLLFDVMNTANLMEFDIGKMELGNLTETSDAINVKLSLAGLDLVDINIRYNIKVKIINTGTDENGKPIYKTAAIVELVFKDCTALSATVVQDCTTKLYFYDNVLYVQGIRSGTDKTDEVVGTTEKVYTASRPDGWSGLKIKYKDYVAPTEYSDYTVSADNVEYVHAMYTIDEFFWMIQNDMKTFLNEFLFYLVPLSKDFTIAHIDLQSKITEAMSGTSGGETNPNSQKTIAQIFKGYSYADGQHALCIGLKELTGSTALSDLNVKIKGENDGDDEGIKGNVTNNYISKLHVDTSIQNNLVQISLNATLLNVRETPNGKIASKGFAPTDVTESNKTFTFDGKPYVMEYNNYIPDVLYTLDGTLYAGNNNELYTDNGILVRPASAASAVYTDRVFAANIAGEKYYEFGDKDYYNNYTYTLNSGYKLLDSYQYYIDKGADGKLYVYRIEGGAKVPVAVKSITTDFLPIVEHAENGDVTITNHANGIQWARPWKSAYDAAQAAA